MSPDPSKIERNISIGAIEEHYAKYRTIFFYYNNSAHKGK